jgi:hypothetical protein
MEVREMRRTFEEAEKTLRGNSVDDFVIYIRCKKYFWQRYTKYRKITGDVILDGTGNNKEIKVYKR